MVYRPHRNGRSGLKCEYRGFIMTKFFNAFLRDESGAAAAEYALILAIVGAGIAAAALTLGESISSAMGRATADINASNADAPPA